MLYLQAIEEFDTGIDCQEARDYDEWANSSGNKYFSINFGGGIWVIS